MTAQTFDVSIIIPTYTEERWDELVAAVRSAQCQGMPPCEIIVVVDHNTTLYERAQMTLSGIVVIENSQPRGASGARNSGIAIAKGRLLAFLDDDVVAQTDWLQRLSACCEDPQVLGVGGLIEPIWLNDCPAWLPKEFYWVIGCSYQNTPEKPISVRNTFLGCTCIRREVFDVIGGFKNEIGRVGSHLLSCEETELCIRALQRWPQKIFLFEPQARTHHHISPYRASWHYFCVRCYLEGFSKAAIARYVGSKDSLSSEWAYTLRILPQGVLRGLMSALFHRDVTGLMHASVIIAGFIMTVTGYLAGSIVLCFSARK